MRSRQCEIAGLEQLLVMSTMIGRLRALIHGLQKERGATNLYLDSQGRYAERVRDYRAEVGAAEHEVRAHLAEWRELPWCHLSTSRFYAHVALVLHGLAELPALREQIDRVDIGAQDAMGSYNELLRRMLSVAFSAADAVSDPVISSAVVALLNFMQGKELAGQERAVGVTGFSHGWGDEGLRSALLNRIDAQERCFQIFSEFADAESLAGWQQLLASPVSAELERSRRLAFAMTASHASGHEMAQIWFDQATRRIDAMKVIEDQLERTMHDLCEHRLSQARLDWRADEALIAAEAKAACGSSLPKGVLLGRPVDASEAGTLFDLVRDQVDGSQAVTSRTLIDLVQNQARRLQTMEGELQAAREALEERKVIEQAKSLLIKYRGMTEDQAHRMLRKTAMDQGKRLIEVARAAIAMADMLGPEF
ncbi:MAG: nitrate- and nitrite sensing domain-containing protein [Pseudomonadota bacterium]